MNYSVLLLWRDGIEQSGYSDRVKAGRSRGQSSSPRTVKIFSLYVIQTGSGAYSVVIEGPFPGIKATRALS
jgi:hypothetical protein